MQDPPVVEPAGVLPARPHRLTTTARQTWAWLALVVAIGVHGLAVATRIRASALAATVVLIAGAQLSAQDLRPIGGFDNVRASDATGESHCYGYSVELWQVGSRVIGLLDVHGGLCGDPPCAVLRDVAFDRRTGHLTFRSVVRTIAYDFVGELSSRRISGTLNGQPVRLRRGADDPMNLDPRHQTLAGWCRFWMSVPRCEGVSDLCESLGQRP